MTVLGQWIAVELDEDHEKRNAELDEAMKEYVAEQGYVIAGEIKRWYRPEYDEWVLSREGIDHPVMLHMWKAPVTCE